MTDRFTSSEQQHAAKPKVLPARRLTLLASVTGLGIALLLSGPASFHPFNVPTAHAVEAIQQPGGFADLVARVKPAVISVRVKIVQSGDTGNLAQNDQGDAIPYGPGSPFEKFFKRFGGLPNGMDQPRQVITGEGSGFFISSDGYAVTNNHVVDHAKSVEVKTDDGATYTARVIGSDPKTDIALIKVDGKQNFTYVGFADQVPRIGDWVVAIGNPFGLGGTVTAGIVSARGRDIGSGPYDDYIQIDAPINKGNSGGPAFDLNGNVIGVNTAIYSPSGGSVGIGFDVPSDTAKLVVAQLKAHGNVTRGWMGVQIQPVTADIANGLGLKTAEGALVDEPQANSPAAKAGIKSGDVITALDGKTVKDSRELARRIGAMSPGTSVKIDLLHQGESKTVTLTLGQVPSNRQTSENTEQTQPESGVPNLGLALAPASEVAGSGGRGVVVMGVEPNGSAAEHGLQQGDIILDVGGKAVVNPSDVRKALTEAKGQGKNDILMRVKSANATKFVALPINNANNG